MSKLVYCEVEPCFRKMLTNTPDDVMRLGWAKTDTGYSCEHHTFDVA